MCFLMFIINMFTIIELLETCTIFQHLLEYQCMAFEVLLEDRSIKSALCCNNILCLQMAAETFCLLECGV